MNRVAHTGGKVCYPSKAAAVAAGQREKRPRWWPGQGELVVWSEQRGTNYIVSWLYQETAWPHPPVWNVIT